MFGYPTGHDDDAARAVRAALAMRDIVKTAETALGDIPLQLRIGLDTGEVAAGLWSGDLRVTGPAVHTAARIQQAAEPDQILLSARTLRAARDMVEVGPAERFDVRGQRQPVEVVEVLGLAPAEPATDPMVGRETDLPRLIAALDHAAHHNRLVLLVGDAGVGKSTLARAATAEIGDRVHVLWGRCLPDWQSLPFWPVREVLAAAAGPGRHRAGRRAHLLHRPAGRRDLAGPGGRPGHRGGAVPAGRPGPGRARPGRPARRGRHPRAGRRPGRGAVRPGQERAGPGGPGGPALGHQRPAGGGLDAGHRRLPVRGPARLPGDQPARAARPAGVAAQDRDPTDRPRPARRAAGGRAARLGARRRRRAGAGRPRLRASKGNPLFVKELAIALREAGRHRPGQPSLPIPDSLQALVAARLDRLPLSAKRVLCRAAVVGKWFSHAALPPWPSRATASSTPTWTGWSRWA